MCLSTANRSRARGLSRRTVSRALGGMYVSDVGSNLLKAKNDVEGYEDRRQQGRSISEVKTPLTVPYSPADASPYISRKRECTSSVSPLPIYKVDCARLVLSYKASLSIPRVA